MPVRNSSIGWRHLMTHYKEQILACDFFTIDTVWLQTIYVLFFIELGSRRIHFAGVTSNPNQTWITQQARQLVWELHDRGRSLQFLIHDNDCSFSKAFDAVFESEGIHIIHAPQLRIGSALFARGLHRQRNRFIEENRRNRFSFVRMHQSAAFC